MEMPSKQNSAYIFNFSQNKVATQLSLVRRSNQLEMSKSNTVPQLAESVIVGRNSKENPQNEFNSI